MESETSEPRQIKPKLPSRLYARQMRNDVFCSLHEASLNVLCINASFAFFSCVDDGSDHVTDEGFPNKHSLTELDLPACPDPSATPAKQKNPTFPKSLAAHRVAGFPAPAEQLAAPCCASPPSVHCTTSQERMDLEMSVLKRQEAVLKLQEEYYTLKIKMMKKQME